MLPNGWPFGPRHRETTYNTTSIGDQSHPQASNANLGATAPPFKTISLGSSLVTSRLGASHYLATEDSASA